MSSVPCTVACVYAHDSVCRCRCGGPNHGAMRREWAGFFCEDCGKSFGKNVHRIWDNGAEFGCGTSEKYLTKAGNRQGAYWCVKCAQKKDVRQLQKYGPLTIRAYYDQAKFDREKYIPSLHTTTPIKELDLELVREIVNVGCTHQQLLGVLREELRLREASA